MTITLKKNGATMHVRREFHDPEVVQWLENVSERLLAEMKEDAAFDEEIAAAIDYSIANDTEKPLTAREFLALHGR
jgi:hypothetical protein